MKPGASKFSQKRGSGYSSNNFLAMVDSTTQLIGFPEFLSRRTINNFRCWIKFDCSIRITKQLNIVNFRLLRRPQSRKDHPADPKTLQPLEYLKI